MIKNSEIFTASNYLSFVRLLAAVPLWFLFNSFELTYIKVIIFVIALFCMLTDFLDGYLARKRNEITEVGKIIDPLADKVLVAVVVLKLFLLNEIPSYYFWIIILRDVLIFIGGILLTKKLGKVLPSNYVGKITVNLISIVILMVVAGISKNNIVYILLYYVSIVFIFLSLMAYIVRARDYIKKGNYGTI